MEGRPESWVTVPRIFVSQVPDQWWGVSCRQVRPGPLSGFGVGCLPGVLEAAAPVTTPQHERMFVPGGVARGNRDGPCGNRASWAARTSSVTWASGTVRGLDGVLGGQSAVHRGLA
jgi:hypothetical protein